MRQAVKLLGNPHKAQRIIHIAGTNGKGSTGAFLESCLLQAGFRVGFYSSPHLASVRERFRIDGKPISEREFIKAIHALRAALGSLRDITYFEVTTLIAFLIFQARAVDFSILETGLGGRWDATNVIESPLVGILTSVGLDHTEYLGSRLSQIAREKSEIFKPGVPAVLGPLSPSARKIVMGKLKRTGSPSFWYGKDFCVRRMKLGRGLRFQFHYKSRWGNLPSLASALRGRHQTENASLALAACEVLSQMYGFRISGMAMRMGIQKCSWPGRLELMRLAGPKKALLLDGAHNSHAAERLAETLRIFPQTRRFHLILGCLRDKNLPAILKPLLPYAMSISLAPPPTERAMAGREMMGIARPLVHGISIHLFGGLREALRSASRAPGRDPILITGSLYLVGEARKIVMGKDNEGNR